ncbi:MAG: ABC transporter permease [Phycisphaerales bacterium]|nr:ABC transporter permease [Phycisphaerales bacterium]
MADPGLTPLETGATPGRGRRRWSLTGVIGLTILVLIGGACLATLPYTVGSGRYDDQRQSDARLPPFWTYPRGAADGARADDIRRYNELVPAATLARVAAAHDMTPEEALSSTSGPVMADLRRAWPRYWLGTDRLGRSLLLRCLAGGGISLGIGLAAAAISVFIGTFYGALSAYAGGKTDAVMMRVVDVLYGLPYVLLVVLIAVAADAGVDEYVSRARARQHWLDAGVARVFRAEHGRPPNAAERAAVLASPVNRHAELAAIALQQARADWGRDRHGPQPTLTSAAEVLQGTSSTGEALGTIAARAVPPRRLAPGARMALDLTTLLAAIGGVSWLTMARVIRGQVLSLKAQPFMEAARAIGVPWRRQFTRHLLPNLVGAIVVYATLTVPQAILQESFLSFLGIGVKPPLPSWGTLAAEGLGELNGYKSHWWLLVFPCLLLGTTLLALNFVGEGLREALDPKRGRR